MADGKPPAPVADAGSNTGTGNPGTTTPPANADANAAGKEFLAGGTETAKLGEADKSQSADGDNKESPPPAPDLELKWPEGFKADPKLEGGFKVVAKELGLDSPKAQKLAEFYVGAQKALAEQQAAAQAQAFEQRNTKWFDSLQSDKDIGGQNFDASKVAATKALERFGSPELRSFLKDAGLQSQPDLVRLLVRVGKSISEDSVAGANKTGGSGPLTPAQQAEADKRALFPSNYSKG